MMFVRSSLEKCVKIGGVIAHIIKDIITIIPFSEVNIYEKIKIIIKNSDVIFTISIISYVAFMVMRYVF